MRSYYLAYERTSAFGAFLGIISGHFTLPYVLWEMGRAFYTFPWKNAPISLPVWIVGALALILSLLICLNTYQKAARETTASRSRSENTAYGKPGALGVNTCLVATIFVQYQNGYSEPCQK